MTKQQFTAVDLIDGLIRRCLKVEPNVVARLALHDEQVRLRHLGGLPEAPDPLDGVEVFARSIVATSLALRHHTGAVSLLTEEQAEAAGYPTARLANLSLTMAWALLATEPGVAIPVLLESDPSAINDVLQLGNLPAMDELLEAFNDGWSEILKSDRELDQKRQAEDLSPGRRHASPYNLLKDMFGIDAHAVELPADDYGPQLTSGSARAACYFAWLGFEMLDLADTLGKEMVLAVRIKTDADAEMAEHPGELASNLALLLGAAINHGTGYTAHFLPPDHSVASNLIEATHQIKSRNAVSSPDLTSKVVDLLDLEDLAGRRHVHVGRGTRERVAQRLHRSVSAAGE